MSFLPRIPLTTYQLPLRYAASWTFAEYAPYPHMGLALAFDQKPKCFIICKYFREQKRWQPLATFTLDKDTHAYLDDNKARMRVLGWRDRRKREDTIMYCDLQFEDGEGLQRVKDELMRFLLAPIVEANSLLKSEHMIDIFRKLPERAAHSVSQPHDMDSEVVSYSTATSRYYRPELACLEDEPVAYTETEVKTSDLFDGWTSRNDKGRWVVGHDGEVAACSV